jgi:hypothetical protein
MLKAITSESMEKCDLPSNASESSFGGHLCLQSGRLEDCFIQSTVLHSSFIASTFIKMIKIIIKDETNVWKIKVKAHCKVLMQHSHGAIEEKQSVLQN